MPISLPLSALGKPVFDGDSSLYPIYAGSPSSGVYADKIWTDLEQDISVNQVEISYSKSANDLSQWTTDFLIANTWLNSTYTRYFLPDRTILKSYSTAIYRRGISTNRYKNLGVFSSSAYVTYFKFPVFLYTVPDGIELEDVQKIYLSFNKHADFTFFTNCFIFMVDDYSEASAILNTVPYTGYTSISIDTETDITFTKRKVLIIPYVMNNSTLTETYYNRIEAKNYDDEVIGILWNLKETMTIEEGDFLVRIKTAT
jgi:hypothetical protein